MTDREFAYFTARLELREYLDSRGVQRFMKRLNSVTPLEFQYLELRDALIASNAALKGVGGPYDSEKLNLIIQANERALTNNKL